MRNGLNLLIKKMTNYLTFKHFAYNMFLKHKEECQWYKIPCKYQSFKSYYNRNRQFLITKYKELRSEQKRQTIYS